MLNRELKYNFNKYAQETGSYVKLELVDENQNLIKNKNVELYIDEVKQTNNWFNIKSSKGTGDINIGIKLLPDFKDGYITGFLIVSEFSLDIINNNELKPPFEKRIFKWEATHNVYTNPLKLGLTWFLIIVLSLLFVWFIFLRNRIYKKFKTGKIIINSPYSKNIKVAGCRKVIFSAKAKKQKTLHKIFAGKILYEVNPLWEHSIEFTPKDKRSLRIKTGVNYSIIPFTNQITRGKSYEIKKNKELIKISYL